MASAPTPKEDSTVEVEGSLSIEAIADTFTDAALNPIDKHRLKLGDWLTIAVLAYLGAVVGLVVVLAVMGRTGEYIQQTIGALQPYLLPPLGALVGYTIGRSASSNSL